MEETTKKNAIVRAMTEIECRSSGGASSSLHPSRGASAENRAPEVRCNRSGIAGLWWLHRKPPELRRQLASVQPFYCSELFAGCFCNHWA